MSKKWIQRAIKHPGALRAEAKREGGISKEGNIKSSWLNKAAKAKGRLGQRARLAKTLKRMREK